MLYEEYIFLDDTGKTKYLYREFSDKFMHEAFRPSA